MRIFNTYGPRMALDDGRVVSNFVAQALTDKPITVYGDGQQTRSFQFVSDLVAGLVAVMDGPHIGPFNVGNPVGHHACGGGPATHGLLDEWGCSCLAPSVVSHPGLVLLDDLRIAYRTAPACAGLRRVRCLGVPVPSGPWDRPVIRDRMPPPVLGLAT